ncbi:heterokaryon incompatibility protein-domain-containing protein [Fusarium tricinctum]|uniref:Heterokaryon incompatibility protein-domain-containing protein n=1 Tax=Fusarium tricinctum TaxID=61284 RepID=A0A8K0RZ24_9HYPO|nr:heterokaryon incompatibility protein-domain-containing protein [Fusarium tricinctum]
MSDQNPRHKPHEHLYRPIEESAYRVVHLLPGTFTDDIRCFLETRPELAMTSYEAISYQWGDESITRPISVAPMRSRLATRWPLLESTNMALDKLLKVIQFYLTPLMPLWILAWCMGTGFVWHLDSSPPDKQLSLDGPKFIPRAVRLAVMSALLGVTFAQLSLFLIDCAIEITETKPLFFLLDLLFDPKSPEQPVEFTTLRMTTNLESALRHLRREKQMRTIWIDALCIDQRNENEKRAQVQRMDRIYANATSTTVWLGGYHGLVEPERCGGSQSNDCEHSRQIEAAFKYVSFLNGWRPFFRFNSDTDEQRLFLSSRHGLIELAKRGWWERLWVIQEVSLSTSRVYILCGHNTCDFDDFQSVWYSLFHKYSEMRYDFMPSVHLMMTIGDFRYSSAHDQLSPSWEDPHKRINPFLPTNLFHGLRFPKRLQRILLQTSGRFKCRDDRDRLYAVLGIAAGVAVGPRRKIAFFMRRPAGDTTTMFIYCLLIHALQIPLENWLATGIIFTLVFRFAPWLWSRCYDLVLRHWRISRPQYLTPECIKDLDGLKNDESDRASFFTALAVYLAQGTGSLSFLDAVSCGEDQEDTQPSWVPDWSKEVSISADTFAESPDLASFHIADAGKTLQVEGRCRTIDKVVHTADQQKLQVLPVWQSGFKKAAALPREDRPILLRLLSELGRLTSPDHSNKLGRSEKWRALWLFFHISNGLKAGLVYMKSQNTTIVYTDNAIAEGLGYLKTGELDKGDLLFSVPGVFHHMVLRQGKLPYRWRIVGLVDMEHKENWAKLRNDDKLRVLTIE